MVFSSEVNLLITNTMFRQPNRNKSTWMHPRSKHRHLLDHVITRKADRRDSWGIKSMCGAICWKNHRLDISRVNIRALPKRHPQGKKTTKRLEISKLKCSKTKDKLIRSLDSRLNNAWYFSSRGCRGSMKRTTWFGLLYCSWTLWPYHPEAAGLGWWKWWRDADSANAK